MISKGSDHRIIDCIPELGNKDYQTDNRTGNQRDICQEEYQIRSDQGPAHIAGKVTAGISDLLGCIELSKPFVLMTKANNVSSSNKIVDLRIFTIDFFLNIFLTCLKMSFRPLSGCFSYLTELVICR